MGWWKTDNGDDVIGDGPADVMEQAFSEIVSETPGDGPVLSLTELLDAVLVALRLNPPVIMEDPDSPASTKLVATVEGRNEKASTTPDPQADARVSRRLFSAFSEISAQYEESELARKPRMSELVAVVDFVLGYRSDAYARITEDVTIERIQPVAVEGGEGRS